MSEIDWSKAPEGATHFNTAGVDDYRWYKVDNNAVAHWRESSGWTESVFDSVVSHWIARPYPTTPALETMLTEWRDLEARAQVAQAEADALVEQAAQLHSVVAARLVELGWGAPVVTLDDSNGWIEWKGGTCPVPNDAYVEVKLRGCSSSYDTGKGGEWGWRIDPKKPSGGDIIAYRLSPSTQP